jgi:hypothetical protein
VLCQTVCGGTIARFVGFVLMVGLYHGRRRIIKEFMER